MIRSLVIFILVMAAACVAQTAGQPGSPTSQQQPQPPTAPSPPAAAQPAPADAAAKVQPTTAVITIHGVCSSTPTRRSGTAATAKPALPGAACKTEITKAQFEKLLKAVNPSNQAMPPAMRRNLAQAYVELMTFNQAAQKAGIDKDPNFLEVMRLVRMRTLQDFYRRSLEEKYRNPPIGEIEAYYKQNLAKYEEVKLSRIFIPAKNPASPNKDDWEKKAAEVANDVHDRAAKGEDFEKLQKEAYTTLGLTITPPTTSMGTRRRGMLAPNQEQELFALKAGEVSKLEQDPSGYITYKVDSKETLPMERVKDEISRELFRQKMDMQLKAVTSSAQATYNDEYFGSPTSAAPPIGTRPKVAPPGAREPEGEKEREQAPKPPTTAAPPNTTPPPAQEQKPPK
jgi:parvulin-like peptidyl-prolyl isomerase